MQAILKQLEDAINSCYARIAECAKMKKEYDAKFGDLSKLEIKLREQGQDLDRRELQSKQIGNIMNYSY